MPSPAKTSAKPPAKPPAKTPAKPPAKPPAKTGGTPAAPESEKSVKPAEGTPQPGERLSSIRKFLIDEETPFFLE
jgi:hypothetical protein